MAMSWRGKGLVPIPRFVILSLFLYTSLMKHYLKEVETATRRLHNKERAPLIEKFMSSKLTSFGLSVPQIRSLVKSDYSFYQLSDEEILRVWDYIFSHSKYFEVKSQALIYYQFRSKELSLEEWKVLKTWSKFIDNWEHADRISGIYSDLHERYPNKIYPIFQDWNKSKLSWLRRLSIVSLFLYSSSRKKQPAFSKVLLLVDNLFFDKDVYVQKGVGWTLRELYNVYPEKTYLYLLKHAADISPTAWQASTEKLSKRDKDRLKRIRAAK